MEITIEVPYRLAHNGIPIAFSIRLSHLGRQPPEGTGIVSVNVFIVRDPGGDVDREPALVILVLRLVPREPVQAEQRSLDQGLGGLGMTDATPLALWF